MDNGFNEHTAHVGDRAGIVIGFLVVIAGIVLMVFVHNYDPGTINEKELHREQLYDIFGESCRIVDVVDVACVQRKGENYGRSS